MFVEFSPVPSPSYESCLGLTVQRHVAKRTGSSNTSCHHLLDHNFLEDIAKDRKVIPDPIDDRFFISISNGHENIGFFKSWKFEAIDIFS